MPSNINDVIKKCFLLHERFIETNYFVLQITIFVQYFEFDNITVLDYQ